MVQVLECLLKSISPPQSTSFDSQYALRLCTQAHKLEACVQIYTQMRLFEDAVELALKVCRHFKCT